MNMIRRIIAAALAACFILSVSVSADAEPYFPYETFSGDDGIMPYSEYYAYFAANYEITSNDYIQCTTTTCLYETKKSVITITIYTSSDKKSWRVLENPMSQTNTVSGTILYAPTSTTKVESGMYYYIKYKLEIYSSSNQVIESSTLYSDIF